VPSPGNPADLNRYAYARNSPLKYVDPSGHSCVYVDGHLDCSEAAAVNGINTLSVDANISGIPNQLSESEGPYIASPDYVPPSPPIPAIDLHLPPPLPVCYAPPPDPQVGPSERDAQIMDAVVVLNAFLDIVTAGGMGLAARGPSLAAQARIAAKGGTYVLVDRATGDVMRSGRTNNLVRRRSEHARDSLLKKFRFEIDAPTDDYNAQRGREQYLHDTYKPPYNYRNPIDPQSLNRQTYINAAKRLRGRY
jgi:hypothetical protein